MKRISEIDSKDHQCSTNNKEIKVNPIPKKIKIEIPEIIIASINVEHIKIVDSIETLVCNLYHKHSSVKLNNLKVLHNRFQNNYLNVTTDDCEWIERLMKILKSLIYNSNLQIQLSSIQLFSSFSFQLASLSHNKYNDIITNVLRPIVNDSTVDINVRCVAIESITASIFFNKSSNSDTIIKIMNLFENIFTEPSTKTSYIKLEIAAIQRWSLLFTILPDHLLVDFGSRILFLSPYLLNNVSVDVRIRVGKCLALIFERIRMKIDSKFVCDGYESLLKQMEYLSSDDRKAINRKDRAKQKREFGEILQSIESYSKKFSKVEKLKFKVKVLSITNWTKKIHYDFIQKILQDGFHLQLQLNILIREIFRLEPLLENDQIIVLL